MKAFLLWLRAFNGALAPQLVFDEESGRPSLDLTTKRALASWTPLAPDAAVE